MFVKGLYMLLSNDPGISSFVNGRVYWILQPKGTSVPSVVLTVVSNKDLYAMSGNAGLQEALVQIDCYGAAYYDAAGTALAVRGLLEDYVGNLPDTDATAVIATFIEKTWDMPYEEGGKGFIYRTLLEVRFHYYDHS